MQLAFAFPKSPMPVNNRVMATNDAGDANKLDAAKKLRNKALRLLTTREHSREELLRKLAQAKARRARQEAQSPAPEKDEIERVVDELAAQGWQSDERYAEAIVRRLTGQASRRYIEEKLAQTGIKKDVAKLALENIEQDDVAVAQALWARRFGETPADDRERQRQIRFLLSRGFHLGDAFKIVPKALAPSTAYSGRMNRQRPVEPSADVSEAADGSGEVTELTRTSTMRKTGVSGGSDMNRSGRWGTSNKTGASNSAAESSGSQLRRSAVKRARPWGARNDADPSDPDTPSGSSNE